ncbi:MAG TPA: undecaprenyl-diphosphate phosphatase [Polyangiaceae bacterium]
MPLGVALLLGIVEGLTEYLPVSSTGHLVLAARVLGRQAGAFEIVIQLGAILAVVVHYRALFAEHARGLAHRRPESLRLAAALALGFVPVAIVGKLAGHAIKDRLFAPHPIAIALAIGGVVMIVVERARAARKVHGESGLDKVTPRRALTIGVLQCFALFPGTSRSMTTIVAGQLTGLSTATAAEFSFLLGVPTLGAATIYEGLKSRHELLAQSGGPAVAVGLITSFFVAWAVVASFLRYLQRRGLEPFGWYRLLLAAVVWRFM